jgi:hypothetical protein
MKIKVTGRKRGAIPKTEVPLNLRCFSLQQLYIINFRGAANALIARHIEYSPI